MLLMIKPDTGSFQTFLKVTEVIDARAKKWIQRWNHLILFLLKFCSQISSTPDLPRLLNCFYPSTPIALTFSGSWFFFDPWRGQNHYHWHLWRLFLPFSDSRLLEFDLKMVSWPDLWVTFCPGWLVSFSSGLSILSPTALKIINGLLHFSDLVACPYNSCELFFPDRRCQPALWAFVQQKKFLCFTVATAQVTSCYQPCQVSGIFFGNVSLRYSQRWKISSKFF